MVNDIVLTKLNESFSCIQAPADVKVEMYNFLRVERPGHEHDHMVQCNLKSKYDFYSFAQNDVLVIHNGHIDMLRSAYPSIPAVVTTPEFTMTDIDDYYQDVKKQLPFLPYDFQLVAFKESLVQQQQINIMSTSSGKSFTISLMLEFFRRKGMKGLLLVPNINLLTQFRDDIADYNLTELSADLRIIGGGNTERVFDKSLTISTWQSLKDYEHLVNDLDYIICDELQYYASEVTSEIVRNTHNCKFKLGFTGTLPDNPCKKMTLIGLFGFPKTYITPRQLIDRGLATPIEINAIRFLYDREELAEPRSVKEYSKKLIFLKEHQIRTNYIVELTVKLRKTGNTLTLFQHTAHGKEIFTDVMKMIYPDVEVTNKDITGKKSFEFQSKYGVYFLNGEDDSKTRDMTKKILETHSDAIIISNFALLSTGVSIKRLFNVVLASPMKSYTIITQTIGRGMRLFPGKLKFRVFDIVDNFAPFMGQFNHRKKTSYEREKHPVNDIRVNLRSWWDSKSNTDW